MQCIESHLRECRRIRRSLELCSDEGEIRKTKIWKITGSTGSLEETSGMQSRKQNNGKQKAEILGSKKTELGELIADSDRRMRIQDTNLKLLVK